MKHYIIIILYIVFFTSMSSAHPYINLSEMTLNEKISQMVMVKVESPDSKFLSMPLGGIFVDSMQTKQDYIELIDKYQKASKYKLLVATDMEGYWNPFPFHQSKFVSEIKTPEEAYDLGENHAKILKELNFTLNFAPVVESKNKVWPNRSFSGTQEEIDQKSISYIKGLQDSGILATAKHYPGGSMVSDPHKFKVYAKIDKNDLNSFDLSIKQNVSAIMVGHAIVSGEINSNNKQSTISKSVISTLREDFDGLIITDAIGMWGLRWSYLFSSKKLYVDLVKAGNDIILDTYYPFSNDYRRVKKGINAIEKAVENKEISIQRIDDSVTRILEKKGYHVI